VVDVERTIEVLLVSILTLVAVLYVYPMVRGVTLRLDDNQEFITDVYYVYLTQGSLLRGYHLRNVTLMNNSIVFPTAVLFNGSASRVISSSIIRVRENMTLDGFCVLRIYYREGYVWIEKQ